ncbi:hypothetical protein [Pedobacter duraquae]|uniref:Tail protein n=1 Tax=Pedobacter duraquae TaxID=425511 RepID=A0A4R6IIS4_9SPHI|nr:hypothetical protein [Pedobacter duraquae]TDO21880.1 hypothetical protein CLV32_2988 [Pedobacter duraquae]
MGYNVKYRLDFCNFYGNKCRIDILKKDYIGQIIPYSAGAEPLEITVVNEADEKFTQITGSEAKISILTSDTFSLQSFYSEDEQAHQVRYYTLKLDTDAYTDSLRWAGYLLPDSANEPFMVAPFESTLQAKDVLGTLKTVPFAGIGGILIQKVDSLKNILAFCLGKTGLDLDFWTGVNTYETNMPSGLADDPLALTFIDTNRYIDTNGKPYSCFDVLQDICNNFSANLKQSNGAWWFVDITQLSKANYNARRYNAAGEYVSRATIANNKLAGLGKELELVGRDHNTYNILALKSVTTYYQYGYLSNKLANGSFDEIWTDSVHASPFKHWTVSNGLAVGRGQKSVTLPTGTILIDDYYAKIANKDLSKRLVSEPISILKTNTFGVSIDLVLVGDLNVPKSGLPVDNIFALELYADGKPKHTWNGSSWTTEDLTFYSRNQWSKGTDVNKTINFSVAQTPHDGSIVFSIIGAYVAEATFGYPIIPMYFDNVNIQADENKYYKSPIGNVTELTQSGAYSSIPDPTVLLFGDDINRERTSWMRLSDGSPTQLWYRFGKTEALKLQFIAAKNKLNQHQKTSILFEGSIMGVFSPMDTINIQMIDAKFFMIGGTFRAKAATAIVKLAQLFTTELTDSEITSRSFEDFGDFKDKEGNALGSSSGITVPPSNGNGTGGGAVDPNSFIKNQSVVQEGAQLNIATGQFNDALTIPGAASVTPSARQIYLDGADGYVKISGSKLKAGSADDSVKWANHLFADYINQALRTTDDVVFNSISKNYVSGFTGSGYKINADGSAEFDSLTVRKDLNINVLNVREITGNGGSVAITNVAKLFKVTDMGSYWKCEINTDDGTIAVQLRANDIVRCQRWDGKGLKYYTAAVSSITTGSFNLTKSSKTGSGIPSAGDSVFQFGNTTDTARQGLIYLTNSDEGAPYIDILDGVTSESLTGKTKVRLGKLSGITDADLGTLDGYGIYAERAFIKGKIVVTGGNAETLAGSQAKANAAQSAAIATASTDAQNKANNAQSNAISSSNSFASTAANNAQSTAITSANAYAASIAQSKADAAQTNAVATASSDAQAKANAAYGNAVAASNAYAVTVANSASSAAQIAAAADASNKANAAYSNAVGAANTAYNNLTSQLRGMAYRDVAAAGGIVTIDNGSVVAFTVDVAYLRANVINAGYIESQIANLGGWSISAAGISSNYYGDLTQFKQIVLNKDGEINMSAYSYGYKYDYNTGTWVSDPFNGQLIASVINPKGINVKSDNYEVATFRQMNNDGRIALLAEAPPSSIAARLIGKTQIFNLPNRDYPNDARYFRNVQLAWQNYEGLEYIVFADITPFYYP